MVKIAGLDDRQDWGEYFFLFQSRAGSNVVDDRWLDIKTDRVVAASARHDLTTLVDTLFNIAEGCVKRTLVDHGPKVGIALRGQTDLEFFGQCDDLFHQLVM